MARTYKRDSRGRFASGGGGSSGGRKSSGGKRSTPKTTTARGRALQNQRRASDLVRAGRGGSGPSKKAVRSAVTAMRARAYYAATGTGTRRSAKKAVSSTKKRKQIRAEGRAKAAEARARSAGRAGARVAAKRKAGRTPARPLTEASITKGIKTTYKAQEALANTHNNKTGDALRRLPVAQREQKRQRIERRITKRRSQLFNAQTAIERTNAAKSYKELRKSSPATARALFRIKGPTKRRRL